MTTPLARWHFLTSEYAPQIGGVADYTRVVAAGLGAAGDDVHVWCPAIDEADECVGSPGVTVHRKLGHFSGPDLARIDRLLDRFPAPRRLLLQWVPHGYGYRAMNLPLCLWLWRRAAFKGDQIDIMVHEPYLPFRAGALRHDVVAAMQRIMMVVLLNSADRVWISIPGWKPRLKPYALGRRLNFTWVPIPSVLPKLEQSDPNEIRARFGIGTGAAIIGHFGAYGSATADSLSRVLPALAQGPSKPHVLLIGAGSEQLCARICRRYPRLTPLMYATGTISAHEVTRHLAACDIVIQPYPDGVSSRRTSVMTALALGIPVITTKGLLTESVWSDAQAVALTNVSDHKSMIEVAEMLLADAEKRKRLGASGRALYVDRFDVVHTITALRNPPAVSAIDPQHQESPATA